MRHYPGSTRPIRQVIRGQDLHLVDRNVETQATVYWLPINKRCTGLTVCKMNLVQLMTVTPDESIVSPSYEGP